MVKRAEARAPSLPNRDGCTLLFSTQLAILRTNVKDTSQSRIYRADGAVFHSGRNHINM